MAARMDPAVSWVAETLDYEALHPAAAARSAALQPLPEESSLARRLGCAGPLGGEESSVQMQAVESLASALATRSGVRAATVGPWAHLP